MVFNPRARLDPRQVLDRRGMGGAGGIALGGGGIGVILWRPEVRWLGCAALPEACVAATDPAAFAFLEEAEAAKVV